MWNDFPYTVFDTGRLGGFKELSIDGFPELCFSVSCDVGPCGVANANYNFFFPRAFASSVNNNNIIIIKKDWQCKAGRVRLTSYQSKDPSPSLPTYRRKEEKGKIVKVKK